MNEYQQHVRPEVNIVTVKTWVKLEVFTKRSPYQSHFPLQRVVQHDWSIETKGAGLTSPQVEVAEGRAHLNFGDESCLSFLIAGNDRNMRPETNVKSDNELEIYATVLHLYNLVCLIKLKNNYPNIESNSLSFFEAQVQFRSGVWSLRLLTQLTLLFHPPR